MLQWTRIVSRPMRILLLMLLFAMTGSQLQAAETDALFNGATGKLILPYLRIGDEVYYVELDLVDVDQLLFKVSLTSVANVTPSGTQDAAAIYGTWSNSDFTLVLGDNGSYSFTNAVSEGGCPLGTESGSFQWEPSTGVFVATPTKDNNGSCGFSGGAGVKRVIVDGNQFQLSLNGQTSVLTAGSGNTGGNSGQTWSLTLTKNGNGSGSVISSPSPGINCGETCQFSFANGTEVTLTATPTTGSYLFEWGGCDSVSGNGNSVCHLVLGSNKTISAKFVSTIMTASIAGTGTGSIVSSPAGISCGTAGTSCSFSFPVGTTASLQAMPSSDSFFQNWSGGCTSFTGVNNSICNVLIAAGQSDNVTVTAAFTKGPVVIARVVGTGSGSITSSNPGISCSGSGAGCSHSFPAGTTVSLTALAAASSTFAGWSGSCTSTSGANGNICNIVLSSDTSSEATVDASFVKNP